MLQWMKRQVKLSIFFKKDSDLTSSEKWVIGLVNLASVIVFWVMSSFLVSDLFESDIYRKPFLITYLNTACFSFYLIPYLQYEKISLFQFIQIVKDELKKGRIMKDGVSYGSDEERMGLTTAEDSVENDSDIAEITDRGSHLQDSDITLSIMEDSSKLDIGVLETIKLSLMFVTLWFSANLVTNSSLSYTSVASQTILSSTSSFFTLLIGFIYSIEKINKSKVYGILLCFLGVIIVTKMDSNSNSNSNSDSSSDPHSQNPVSSNLIIFFGNMLALSGALIYGIYTILLKVKTIVKHSHIERNLNTHLFFAFVGLFCLFLLWPIIIILHVTGVEKFAIPTDSHILTLLLINMFITFISDFCWCKAVILTSPLTVTVGLSLTIPLAMVGDWVLKLFKFNWIYATGATIVTIGFLIINNDERNDFTQEF